MLKKVFILILSTALLSTTFIACSQTASSNKVIKIGISQLVEHPALDSAREGFIEALKEAGYEDGKNIKIDFQNAQNDITNAQTIARKFVDEKVDMILAIATPAAQAAANVTKDIPILITAVTDPVSAGLAESLEKPGRNVTGTTDMNPVAEQIKLVKDLVPDAKNVGILYNSGEINSKVQVDIAKQAAKEYDLNIIEATVSNSNEVSQATQSLMGRVDAIYVPTDNTIVSSIGAVIKVANEHKVPVIGSERGQVEAGAVATKGIDYKELGKQTGRIAVEIIKGKKPQDIPIEGAKNVTLIINQKAAETIGLTIPKEILEKADEVIK
ncbi:ABC transporter substrate-binding protein [Caldicoprobacter algeriensis]|uniref:ABC transporter substrate-binding protein n=1 Tax=Caldicoprobacter algeriensis TaxID=699281 RepID=UPI00207A9DF6|nr:ABC transporter substrate-binding protein [Caldicoprobacter algeriensis]MCM8900728.1 ABC transporter substrate-binding protein [Caldicoprobacter algeriensis]